MNVRQALYELLAGDATLTGLLVTPDAVWFERAPAGVETPFIVFDKASGIPSWTFAGGPMNRNVWLVKAVDRGPSADGAEAIAARIDTLLNRTRLTLTGGRSSQILRQADVQYPEADGGDTYHHVGGLYRVVTQP